VATFFVSDLHLHPSRPALIEAFLGFLRKQGGRAEAIYILGDLFEAWVGDDDPEPAYTGVRLALKQCVDAGTPVYVMHGNRDFMIGEQFATQTGCTLIEDPTRIDLYGTPTLLMHGDSLCTDDTDYQALREKVRSPQWQQAALELPLAQRLELAQQARELSALANRGKEERIMDVNAREVRRVIEAYEVRLLIHGHTHRAGIYPVETDQQAATRIDLGDWYESGSTLVAGPQGWHTEQLS